MDGKWSQLFYRILKILYFKVGLYLAEKWEANLILYITDMPTTAAWLNYAFGPVPTHDSSAALSLWQGLEEKLYGESNMAEEPFRDGEVGKEVMKIVQKHFPGETELLRYKLIFLQTKTISKGQ